MAVLAVGVAAVSLVFIGFALGRATASEAPPSSPETDSRQVFVARHNDVVRVPDVGLFCIVGFELRQAKMLCNREGRNRRYQVVFYRSRTQLGVIGDPGKVKTFPER
jgi:hypothetical protein